MVVGWIGIPHALTGGKNLNFFEQWLEPVIVKVHEALVKALAAPEVQKRYAELGVEGRASTPEELKTFYASETKRWTQVVERARIPKQ